MILPSRLPVSETGNTLRFSSADQIDARSKGDGLSEQGGGRSFPKGSTEVRDQLAGRQR